MRLCGQKIQRLSTAFMWHLLCNADCGTCAVLPYIISGDIVATFLCGIAQGFQGRAGGRDFAVCQEQAGSSGFGGHHEGRTKVCMGQNVRQPDGCPV